MNDMLNRRFFLRLTTAAIGAVTTGSVSFLASAARAQTAVTDASTDAIERIAYLLFPHPDLGAAPYRRVAESIAADTGAATLIRAGLAELDAMRSSDWLDRNEEEQLADLASFESDPFFQYMLAQTKARLYNDRAVWEFLGYGGSSMRFGGYIDRGLDDIDWLEDA